MIEAEGETVTGYVEKPTLHYEVSMGIYVYSPCALDHSRRAASTSPTSCCAARRGGAGRFAYHFEGDWFDIGTRDEHERAVAAFDADPKRYEAD